MRNKLMSHSESMRVSPGQPMFTLKEFAERIGSTEKRLKIIAEHFPAPQCDKLQRGSNRVSLRSMSAWYESLPDNCKTYATSSQKKSAMLR